MELIASIAVVTMIVGYFGAGFSGKMRCNNRRIRVASKEGKN